MTADLHASLDWSGLEIIGTDECFELLGRAPVGRLGFMDRGEPVILPVNYAVDGRSLVFRTGLGSKLTAGVRLAPVCLEIDSFDPVDHSGWSVLAKGVADEVLDDTEIARFEALPVRPWSNPDLRCHWVRILVEEVTGRRVAVPSL